MREPGPRPASDFPYRFGVDASDVTFVGLHPTMHRIACFALLIPVLKRGSLRAKPGTDNRKLLWTVRAEPPKLLILVARPHAGATFRHAGRPGPTGCDGRTGVALAPATAPGQSYSGPTDRNRSRRRRPQAALSTSIYLAHRSLPWASARSGSPGGLKLPAIVLLLLLRLRCWASAVGPPEDKVGETGLAAAGVALGRA